MTTPRAPSLERSRPYGVVYGGGPIRYEQDHRHFDHQGREVDQEGQPVLQVPKTMDRGKRPASSSDGNPSGKPGASSAERVRRLRERRRQGVRFVLSVPVTDLMIDALIQRGLINDEAAGNRDMIAQALTEAIEAWSST